MIDSSSSNTGFRFSFGMSIFDVHNVTFFNVFDSRNRNKITCFARAEKIKNEPQVSHKQPAAALVTTTIAGADAALAALAALAACYSTTGIAAAAAAAAAAAIHSITCARGRSRCPMY